MVDSDYAKNTDNRKSISSGLHTLGGTLVHWESKTQHVVTLSSTEAEYVSLARGACENKFIMMLLDEGIQKPDEKRLMGKIYKDNLGAIYLVKNQHVGARTKHIDVRAHFIRELLFECAVYPIRRKCCRHFEQELSREITYKTRE
jgi:hypothetical protein